MSPNVTLSGRLIGAVRFGCALSLLVIHFLAGCSQLGLQNEKVSLAPSLEMGQRVPPKRADTEPFALTNKGREIEENLLDRQQAPQLPE